jgi:hypothetical protein
MNLGTSNLFTISLNKQWLSTGQFKVLDHQIQKGAIILFDFTIDNGNRE